MNSVFVRLDFGGLAKFGYLEIRILFGVRDFVSVPNGAAGAASRPHMVQGWKRAENGGRHNVFWIRYHRSALLHGSKPVGEVLMPFELQE